MPLSEATCRYPYNKNTDCLFSLVSPERRSDCAKVNAEVNIHVYVNSVFPQLSGEGSLDFIRVAFSSFFFSSGGLGSQLRVPDLSGHCRAGPQRSQWARPDFNHELQISVCATGPQPRAPDLKLSALDLTGHCPLRSGAWG